MGTGVPRSCQAPPRRPALPPAGAAVPIAYLHTVLRHGGGAQVPAGSALRGPAALLPGRARRSRRRAGQGAVPGGRLRPFLRPRVFAFDSAWSPPWLRLCTGAPARGPRGVCALRRSARTLAREAARPAPQWITCPHAARGPRLHVPVRAGPPPRAPSSGALRHPLLPVLTWSLGPFRTSVYRSAKWPTS